VANVVLEVFFVKQEALDKEDTPISSLHFPSLTFILNESFYEDVYLFVNSDINVFGSFSALVSDVCPMEDMPSNLNQVQG
jgi:hypothetical protein